jgi:hypothetical protein
MKIPSRKELRRLFDEYEGDALDVFIEELFGDQEPNSSRVELLVANAVEEISDHLVSSGLLTKGVAVNCAARALDMLVCSHQRGHDDRAGD